MTGTVPGVVDALSADVLVVPALGAEGPGLYLLPADQATLSPVVSLDQTRPLAEVTLTGAEATRVAVGQQAVDAVEAALLTGAVLLAAEQLGTAEWAFDTTVAYLKERVQFARPIGSFKRSSIGLPTCGYCSPKPEPWCGMRRVRSPLTRRTSRLLRRSLKPLCPRSR